MLRKQAAVAGLLACWADMEFAPRLGLRELVHQSLRDQFIQKRAGNATLRVESQLCYEETLVRRADDEVQQGLEVLRVWVSEQGGVRQAICETTKLVLQAGPLVDIVEGLLNVGALQIMPGEFAQDHLALRELTSWRGRWEVVKLGAARCIARFCAVIVGFRLGSASSASSWIHI